MPGAQMWDIVKRLLRLVRLSDYYPLLLFYMGINDTQHDYMALRMMVKDVEVSVLFSLIQLMRRRISRWREQMLWVNN